VGAGDLQQKISLTKAEEKLAIIDCHFTSDCRYYIHWYQQKEGEPLKRILYANINDGSSQNDAGFESIKSEKKTSNHFALKITKLKKEHSAMYYCACWIWSGSSTVHINTKVLHKNSARFPVRIRHHKPFLKEHNIKTMSLILKELGIKWTNK